MSTFTPIIRTCDHCPADLSVYSLLDNYPACIVCDGLTLCGECWRAYVGIEAIEITYTPHTFVMPDVEPIEDDEPEIEADAPEQLQMAMF